MVNNMPMKKLASLAIFRFLIILVGLGLYLLVFNPVDDIKTLNKGYVSFILNSEKKPIYTITKKKPKHWVRFNQISKKAAMAIMISEDWGFYNHPGYDTNQIKEAVFDIVKGKRFRGASTISQQLVKNVFLSSEKSLWRKLKELVITHQMESRLSKNKILEVYLNSIEFGVGLYGVKNASYFYFKKHPAFLTAREGAFLAMLLPNPKIYSQSYKDKKLTEYANKIVESVLKKLVQARYITSDEKNDLSHRPFSWEKNQFD